jgi:hypothetical protein
MIENKISIDPFKLWESFGEAIGIDKLHNFYGEYWPRSPLSGEFVWEWTDNGNRVGWSSVRRDILDPVIWMMVGIWPRFQNQGYNKEIIKWTVREGFIKFIDAQWLFVAVSKKNVEHLETRFKYQAKYKTKWIVAGEMFEPPPGYVIFGISKERYLQPIEIEDRYPETDQKI